MQVLAKNKMVNGMDCDWKQRSGSANAVWRERVTGCLSNSLRGKGQNSHSSWFTVACEARSEPDHWAEVNTSSH